MVGKFPDSTIQGDKNSSMELIQNPDQHNITADEFQTSAFA